MKLDVGEIVWQVDELMVLNNEVHHVHDPNLTWYLSIRDIRHIAIVPQIRTKMTVCLG